MRDEKSSLHLNGTFVSFWRLSGSTRLEVPPLFGMSVGKKFPMGGLRTSSAPLVEVHIHVDFWMK